MKSETYRIWNEGEYHYELAFGFIPKVTGYLHEDGQKRPCIIVVPGGGYCVVSPTEGELVALRFYEKGYQTFVLTYTTNLPQVAPLRDRPLQDISRAVRFIRKKAGEFRVQEERIAVCGFSAGGHLCASLCVHYDDVVDENARYAGISNRPDAAILSYPVITAGDYAHRGSFDSLLGFEPTKEELTYWSLEKQVSGETPPCFVWATATDELVPVENSEFFVHALREKGVACAFHMFSYGKHGLSLANEEWADGIHQDTVTLEQQEKVIEKLQEGAIEMPEERRIAFEQMSKEMEQMRKEKEASGQKFRIGEPNPQVAIWPELADAFLKDVYR